MPKIIDHARRRREIVMALWGVIHERGIAGASLRAVADEAGISIGRIQHYFASKDELVRAGCQDIVEVASARHADGAAEPPGPRGAEDVPLDPGAARDELARLLRDLVPHGEAARVGASVWYAYVAHAAVDAGIARLITESMHGVQELAASLLAAADGRRAPGAADRVEGLALVALADGLAQRVVVGAVDTEAADASSRAALAAALERLGG